MNTSSPSRFHISPRKTHGPEQITLRIKGPLFSLPGSWVRLSSRQMPFRCFLSSAQKCFIDSKMAAVGGDLSPASRGLDRMSSRYFERPMSKKIITLTPHFISKPPMNPLVKKELKKENISFLFSLFRELRSRSFQVFYVR